jgi:hypothetical protein
MAMASGVTLAPVKMYTDIPRAWRAQICDPWAVIVVVTRKPLVIWRWTALAGWRLQRPQSGPYGTTMGFGTAAAIFLVCAAMLLAIPPFSKYSPMVGTP